MRFGRHAGYDGFFSAGKPQLCAVEDCAVQVGTSPCIGGQRKVTMLEPALNEDNPQICKLILLKCMNGLG